MQQADRAHSATDALASSGNISITSASRRGIMAAFAALPVAVMAAEVSVARQPATRFQQALAANAAAEAHFNALPRDLEFVDPGAHAREEERLSAAWCRATRTEPASWVELTQLLALLTADGQFGVDEDDAAYLLGQARRLLEMRPGSDSGWMQRAA